MRLSHLNFGVAAAILVSMADACVASAGPATGESRLAFQSDRARDHSRDVLTAREWEGYPTLRLGTVYEAILALRPEYLALRVESGGRSPSTPLVIIDGISRGGLDVLRGIHASTVVEVRLLRPKDALVRYGQDYRAGALVVTTATR